MGGLIVLGRLNDVSELLGAFGPDERRTGLVVMSDELQQILLQFLPRAMHALPQPAPRQDAEETLGQVHPGSVRGGMVKMHLGMSAEPALGGGAFVDVEVIQNL